jgi:hypothetical protein
MFANGSPAVKEKVYTQVSKLMSSSDMAPYLSQSIGDNEFARILTAGTLVEIMGSPNGEKSWDDVMKLISTADVERGLKMTADKDFYDDVTSAATEMGENAGRFTKIMQTLYSVNPDVADANFDRVKDYFTAQQNTVELEGSTGIEYKVTEFTSHGPDPFLQIPEKYREEIKSDFFDRITAELIDKGGNFDFTTVEYLPGGLIAFKGSFGETLYTADASKFIVDERTRVLKKE